MSTGQVIRTEQVHELVQREFHHRFYNSLQLVESATRTLACDRIDEQRRRPLLRELHERVAMLAQMHRLLAEPIETDQDLAPRFELLCQTIAKAFDRTAARIELSIAPPAMPPSIARGMMLLMVELVTNAFKHGAYAMTLRVELEEPFPGLCLLTVRNSAGAASAGPLSLPRIASQLARSLGGVLSIDGGAITDATAIVPIGSDTGLDSSMSHWCQEAGVSRSGLDEELRPNARP